MSEALSISKRLPELRQIVCNFGVDVAVEAVTSIQQWCQVRGLEESNPFLCGQALEEQGKGRHLILLADPITPEMRSSVVSAMEYHGRLSADDIGKLRDPEVFVRHLVLHEMAHVLDHERSEEDCDRWAFAQLHTA